MRTSLLLSRSEGCPGRRKDTASCWRGVVQSVNDPLRLIGQTWRSSQLLVRQGIMHLPWQRHDTQAMGTATATRTPTTSRRGERQVGRDSRRYTVNATRGSKQSSFGMVSRLCGKQDIIDGLCSTSTNFGRAQLPCSLQHPICAIALFLATSAVWSDQVDQRKRSWGQKVVPWALVNRGCAQDLANHRRVNHFRSCLLALTMSDAGWCTVWRTILW